jgi:hypothetical protein
VKIRLLSEIDLARICPLAVEQRRRALEAIRYGHPPYSYAPVRANISDVLNVRAGMMGALPRVPWEKIAHDIRRRSKNDAEEDANLRVGRGLFDYADERMLSGRHHEIYPLALGVGTKVVYWHSVVLSIDKRPLVPFFDPRRTKELTVQGRRFVFSVMHERIRAADPDFSDVPLGIFQFSLSEKGPRVPILYTDTGVKLFTFEELDQMVRDTYEMWREVCEERAADIRRRAGGKRGGLV